MSTFEDFGYKTNAACDVCGVVAENQLEPRFGYVVCKDHYTLPPLEVSELRHARQHRHPYTAPSPALDIQD